MVLANLFEVIDGLLPKRDGSGGGGNALLSAVSGPAFPDADAEDGSVWGGALVAETSGGLGSALETGGLVPSSAFAGGDLRGGFVTVF